MPLYAENFRCILIDFLGNGHLGIDDIFTDDVIYTESWGPKYENRKMVKHWFDEWNTRGRVLLWEIKQFFFKVIKPLWSGILKTKWIMEISKNLTVEEKANWF